MNVNEDSSLTEEMMRLSFTRFFTRVTTTPNNLGFISIRIPVFLLFSFIEKIVKIIFNSHALSRQRNAERILKITVEPPQVHSCISDDVNLIWNLMCRNWPRNFIKTQPTQFQILSKNFKSEFPENWFNLFISQDSSSISFNFWNSWY